MVQFNAGARFEDGQRSVLFVGQHPGHRQSDLLPRHHSCSQGSLPNAVSAVRDHLRQIADSLKCRTDTAAFSRACCPTWPAAVTAQSHSAFVPSRPGECSSSSVQGQQSGAAEERMTEHDACTGMKQGRRRRRWSGAFAAVSGSPVRGEWTWPKLPQWKPPRIPDWGHPLWVALSPPGQPSKQRLMDVKSFFQYTEEAGRDFFGRLDRDGDGRVRVEDVKALMRARKLPEHYATRFIAAARGNRWWSNSIGWEDFQAFVDEREPKMLRAFTAMEVNPAGQLELKHIKSTLTKLGLSASDDNAKAMIKALGAEDDGFVSYGKFRDFLILLPQAKLVEQDPNIAWFEAATLVPFGPPRAAQRGRTGRLLVRAALAGGIASSSTTLMMFPLDTLKTRVQSAAGASIGSVVRSVPDIGLRGLYRGVLPAVSGQFVSHGLRTFAYEGSLTMLKALTGGAAELQMQGLASGVGTVLGTCVRIPCEVLKQRLQIGRHDNVVAAFNAARRTDGMGSLFRGTSALLLREVPFYVCGLMAYTQLKSVFNGSAFGGGSGRELAHWEVIAIGGLAGGLAAIATTPADVLKTRIMTSTAAQSVTAGAMLASIVQTEGVGALFKGCLVRACWTAPLGAFNFAGYELAKNAMDKQDERKDALQAAQHPAAVS